MYSEAMQLSGVDHKEPSQVQTEDSSHLACDVLTDRQNEKKLKYRRLKQKLSSMGYTHDDKCAIPKEFSSPKKQRLLKLALDFEKQVRIQTREYESLEMGCREILKIVEAKNEFEIQLLRQSKFVPAFFQLLQKVPSLYKSQFQKVVRSLEIGFKILWIFSTFTANREYLILTNRLNSLISLISWILGKDQRIAGSLTPSFYAFQTLCFRLVTSLLLHKSREQESIAPILSTTLQLVICSPIFKKIRNVVFEQLSVENTFLEPELLIQMLKFTLQAVKRSQNKYSPIQSIGTPQVYNWVESQSNGSLSKLLEFLVGFLMGYFTLLQHSQGDGQEYPTFVETLLLLTAKVFNACFEVSVLVSHRAMMEMDKQNTHITQFLLSLLTVIKYCKHQFDQYPESRGAKNLLNELIVLVGYVAFDNTPVKRRLAEDGILEEIFNLPIQYLMDGGLRNVIVPTICCLVFQCKFALNLLLKDNSPLQVIKYLRKEIQMHPTLTRKASTTSLSSLGVNSHCLGEEDKLALSMRFPRCNWEALCSQLQRHV